jgi:ESF2/ABP1 family protein
MPGSKRNAYLDANLSDASDHDAGYDSEAAERSKAERPSKRKRVRRDSTDYEDEEEERLARRELPEEHYRDYTLSEELQSIDVNQHEDRSDSEEIEEEGNKEFAASSKGRTVTPEPSSTKTAKSKSTGKKKDKKKPTPGVIYLSSLPPYLRPSALRNILSQRGFGPIKRLFLAPIGKSHTSRSNAKKSNRDMYSEGWIEFASRRTARICAETLNAKTVGGKKGGFYRDDVWNMKYLRGMTWDDLMGGVSGEKRAEEAARDEERRIIAAQNKAFYEAADEARRQEGMKRKRLARDGVNLAKLDKEAEAQEKKSWTWRQNQVHGPQKGSKKGTTAISEDAKQVLGKIF